MIPKKNRHRPRQRPLRVERPKKSAMRRAFEREASRQSPDVAAGMMQSFGALRRRLGREPTATDVAKSASTRLTRLEAGKSKGARSSLNGRFALSDAQDRELSRRMGIVPPARTIDTPYRITFGAHVESIEAERVERAARKASPAPTGKWSEADDARMNVAMGIADPDGPKDTPFRITIGEGK